MLIFPDREDVRIYYGMTFVDTIGLILSLLGVVAMVFEKRISGKITSMIPDERFDEYLESLNKYKIWIIIFGILIVFGLLITYNNSHHTSMLKDDRFGIELAIASGKYTICDSRVKNLQVREECFKQVGVKTNDYNLCAVRIENLSLRDECFKEISIATGDLNLCLNRIHSEELKYECSRKIRGLIP
jgi:hypothetical protein